MLPNIVQATLINFGRDVYMGESIEEAKEAVLKTGFEAVILVDGATVAYYSPIGGWKNY